MSNALRKLVRHLKDRRGAKIRHVEYGFGPNGELTRKPVSWKEYYQNKKDTTDETSKIET